MTRWLTAGIVAGAIVFAAGMAMAVEVPADPQTPGVYGERTA